MTVEIVGLNPSIDSIRSVLHEATVGQPLSGDSRTFLSAAFIWHEHDRGHDFWADIGNRGKPFTEDHAAELQALVSQETT